MTHDRFSESLTEPSLSDSRVAHLRNKGTREHGERGKWNEGAREVGHLAFPSYERAACEVPALIGDRRWAAMR